jgi:hypothetical protein
MSEEKFERKLKHLEFIQNVITRMNTNSFMVKGWAVTLVAALFALSDKTHEHHLYLIAFITVPLFWLLDGFFLATERRYRDLYKKVSKTEEANIDFDMNQYCGVNLIELKKNEKWCSSNRFSNWFKLNLFKLLTWAYAVLSVTSILFYGVMLIVMFVVKSWVDV